jgi:rod shape determining protein RodA
MIRSWRDYNFFLLGCVLVLTGFSLAMVYSATLRDPQLEGYFARHIVNLIVGTAAMLIFTAIDYHALQAWSVPIYLATVVALGVVLAAGQIASGAQSWLDLGLRTLQPSEPAKLLIIIALAAYWERFDERAGEALVQLGALILLAIPLLLIFLQPDFGTAMVFATAWLMMAWVGGMRWWQLIGLGLAAAPASYLVWNEVLQPYQKLRLQVFLDPLKYDPELRYGAWNVIQSLNAISSGGLTGRGWTLGLVSQGNYLPVRYTDFIFAVTAEELGFIGGTVLLIFLGVLIWQAFTVASTARDTFGRLLAAGIGGMFLCHVVVNVGMNMSVMPITGIPLPFISYGGSFSLTSMAAIGLLQSVALRRHRLTF